MGSACSRGASSRRDGARSGPVGQAPKPFAPLWSMRSPLANGTADDDDSLDTLRELTTRSMCANVDKFDSFGRLPQDLSQALFERLAMEHRITQDALKRFEGCCLRRLDLSIVSGVTDGWVEPLEASACGSLDQLNVSDSHLTADGLARLLEAEPGLRSLALSRTPRLSAGCLAPAARLACLSELRLEGCAWLGPSSLESLAQLPALRYLDLTLCAGARGGLHHLSALPLETLLLGWCGIADADLEHVRGHRRLQRLALPRTAVTDAGAAHLAAIASLRSLDLRGCSISAVGLAHLASLCALAEIDLAGTLADDAGLALLAAGPAARSLESVNAANTGLTDTGLAALARAMPSLTRLHLDSCQVSDLGLAALAAHCQKLEDLDLSDTAVGDPGMDCISALPRLRKLNLSCTAVSDLGMPSLARVRTLTWLNADVRLLSERGLLALAPLRDLETLDVFGAAGVGDAAAAVIAKQFRKLQSLELCGGRLGNAGMAQLASLDSLTSLNVAQNRGVSDQCVPALVQGLRRLTCLNVTHTRLGSPGALQLVRMRRLRSLSMGDTSVSKEAAAQIAAACPLLAVQCGSALQTLVR